MSNIPYYGSNPDEWSQFFKATAPIRDANEVINPIEDQLEHSDIKESDIAETSIPAVFGASAVEPLTMNVAKVSVTKTSGKASKKAEKAVSEIKEEVAEPKAEVIEETEIQTDCDTIVEQVVDIEEPAPVKKSVSRKKAIKKA